MVMQVKKATFQRKKVVERVELKIDGMYQVHDSLHHFHGKYIKKSQRLTVRATTDLFPVTLQSAVL